MKNAVITIALCFFSQIIFSQSTTGSLQSDKESGMDYYRQEDYGKAKIFLEKAVKENDKDAEAAYTLGRTYIELENENAAIPLYLKALAAEPSKVSWTYELALLYYNKSDYANAIKYFNVCADKGYPKSNDFYENLGFAQLYNNDVDNGMKNLNIVLERKPNNTELLNNIANAFYETKKYDDALDYFAKLLTLNPKDATSLYMAGMAFQKKGEKDKGQKLCDKAIAMDPSLAKNRQKKDVSMGL